MLARHYAPSSRWAPLSLTRRRPSRGHHIHHGGGAGEYEMQTLKLLIQHIIKIADAAYLCQEKQYSVGMVWVWGEEPVCLRASHDCGSLLMDVDVVWF